MTSLDMLVFVRSRRICSFRRLATSRSPTLASPSASVSTRPTQSAERQSICLLRQFRYDPSCVNWCSCPLRAYVLAFSFPCRRCCSSLSWLPQTRGHGIPVDWWALGVLIYEMLAGLPPFFDETPYGIYQKILKGRLRFPRGFDVKASDLVAKLLTMDPTRRLGEHSSLSTRPYLLASAF